MTRINDRIRAPRVRVVLANGDQLGVMSSREALARAQALGLDPAAFLADNDSTGFFERLGDLLAPGPTHTNVNDLRCILVN